MTVTRAFYFRGRTMSKLNNEDKNTIKMISNAVQRADDMTIALDFIKSAIMLDSSKEATANDGHILTNEEQKAIVARLLIKALTVLDDHEIVKLLDEENDSHDAHAKLLLNLINVEYEQMQDDQSKKDESSTTVASDQSANKDKPVSD